MDMEKLERELAQAGSMEEIQEILKNNGVEMTMDEIQKIMEEAAPEGELSEENLDAVAGGAGMWLGPRWKPNRFLMEMARLRQQGLLSGFGLLDISKLRQQ